MTKIKEIGENYTERKLQPNDFYSNLLDQLKCLWVGLKQDLNPNLSLYEEDYVVFVAPISMFFFKVYLTNLKFKCFLEIYIKKNQMRHSQDFWSCWQIQPFHLFESRSIHKRPSPTETTRPISFTWKFVWKTFLHPSNNWMGTVKAGWVFQANRRMLCWNCVSF